MGDLKIGSYHGVDILLTESKLFLVGGETFSTYRDATDEIDRLEKVSQSQKRKKLNLSVIGCDCVKRTITGIHAAHGDRVVSPKFTEKFGGVHDLYPCVDWIQLALAERDRLKKEQKDIEDALRTFRLDRPILRGRLTEQMHSEVVDFVQKDFDKKISKAAKMDLEKAKKLANKGK